MESLIYLRMIHKRDRDNLRLIRCNGKSSFKTHIADHYGQRRQVVNSVWFEVTR